MKKIVVVLVSFIVAVLIGMGNAFAQDKTPKASIPNPSLSSKWILLGRDSYGTTEYVNTRRITHLPKDIVKVWALYVLRGEERRREVNAFKKILPFKGKDPNEAKKFWYEIDLHKINCKTHQVALLKYIAYSFGGAVLDHQSIQHEKWGNIPPESLAEIEEKYACNEAPIPNPSLSSKWKLVLTGSDWSTFYVDTRRITYLPKGIVKVWTLDVPRGEFRRTQVNGLKKTLLSKGEAPNKAERLWYEMDLEKVNCKNNQVAPLEYIAISFRGGVPLYSHSFQHEEWDNIIPRTFSEIVERYVCKKYRR